MLPVSSVQVVYKPTAECISIARKYSEVLRTHGITTGVSVVDDVDSSTIAGKDLIVSIGGDGTILRISRCLQKPTDTPLILPHQCGRRNSFYEDVTLEVDSIIERVLKGDFTVQLYPRGKVCVKENCFFFLNEAALINADLGKVAGFTVAISSPGLRSKYDFEGDGLIVSTAPGSAGYNLSARGPLTPAGLEILIVTHLNPIQLGMPSIIVEANLSVIEVSSRDYSVLYIDGENTTSLGRREPVRVTGSSSYLKIIRFSGVHDTVRRILGKRRIVY
ncbi:MAG: NAD(+)/NADH kinase [Desulfurococcus sp.]|nr:NAD(+)/NADH kinase [Desulfurococcus sp.]